MNKDTFTAKQQDRYDFRTSQWSMENETIVGSFQQHNEWPYYEALFTDLDTKNLKMLDFGCGPGRNIVKYWDRFSQIDGVDISEGNLKNAKWYIAHSGLDPTKSNLYKCNGQDLNLIGDNQYDIIMSTITLHHICVHEVRYGYFKEFLRVLKPGGLITIQMVGKGPGKSYFANHYDWDYDVFIEDPNDLKKDLEEIGFVNFSYTYVPCGPGDIHENWIIFRAFKPE